MHNCPLFIIPGFIVLLLSNVAVTTPDILYRGDSRTGKTIKDGGGFKAKGYNNPEGTLFEHVEGQPKYPSRDPYIPTSESLSFFKGYVPEKGRIFFIDSSKIIEDIFDVQAEYDKAGLPYGHAVEKEFAVGKSIPWEAITKVLKKNEKGEWVPIKLSTYATLVGADIFEDVKPSKGWALSIAMVSMVNSYSGSANIRNAWRFFTTGVKKAVGSCGETDGQELTPSVPMDSRADPRNPPWPAGDFTLIIEGEECHYKCDGTNPGSLFCPDRGISCAEDTAKSSVEGMKNCDSRVSFHAVVYCDF
ncbi:uncharacterized protein ALTATR162_LOCUS3526 [Alternaria atra]|uniref:Uncharacterized protein n=1 Tax=Alternaria atra TaxID=119953 RepID=A0A8J2HWY5_9PLEO|nr:uncharacterized protein ALTATR162_LOCUS3526 [Alternaria atra]CAG5154237.1 unnamed protein product [Alternaria atra]